MATADITVMGAGIFGLSVAWACLQRGAKVQVIDPGGVGAGTSGGIVGALAPHVPENWNEKKAFQFDSLVMAETFWAEVDQTSGLSSGYRRAGRIQPVPEGGLELAHTRAETAKELWQGQFQWRVEKRAAQSWLPASQSGYYIMDDLSAHIHPRQACGSLAAAIVTQGGMIADAGAPKGQVVWATGVGGLTQTSLGRGEKGQAALLDFAAQDLPQIFAKALHFIPHSDGTVAIGSTSERDFSNPTDTDDKLDDLIARARAIFPVLKDAPVLERWAGLRPRANTRAPVLGVHPANPGAFIANGGFKIGFGMAPKVGAVMADLILDGHDAIPDGFRAKAE